MKHNRLKWITLVFTLSTIVLLGGCKKKVAPPPPPPPPPPAAPTASLTANPDSIQQGQSTTLSWQTQNATDVSIDNGVGTVEPSGSKQVTPNESATYHLTAKGPGGTTDATARVTVTPPPPPPQPSATEEELFAQNVKDVFFDYDKYDLRNNDEAVLSNDAAFLKSHPTMKVTIGGYCDERGSNEYNLALGENRANSAQKLLIASGIASTRIRVVSYGKEKPFCSDETESCWQQNRRAGFALDR